MANRKKYDWTRLKQRYFAGEWLTFPQMAADLKMNLQVIKAKAGQEKWFDQRNELIREAESRAKARILGKLTSEFERRLTGMLQTADVLRYKGLEVLSNVKTVLNTSEAIKAVIAATDIETEIFLGRNRQRSIQAAEESVPIPLQTVTPGESEHEHTEADAAEVVRVLLEAGAIEPTPPAGDKAKAE